MTPGSHATGVADTDGWLALPPSLAIADGHVHVVRASAQAASSTALAGALRGDERARAARIRRPGGRARFIAGRVVLRELLARCAGEVPPDAPLIASSTGKPRLAGPGAPSFSISHAGDVVLVALARAEVGVDVETPRPGLDPLALARRWLGVPAAEHLAALEPDARPAGFLALWTRHEATVKCRGVGLAGDPTEADGLAIRSLTLPGAYTGAVAATEPFKLSRWAWPVDAPLAPEPRGW